MSASRRVRRKRRREPATPATSPTHIHSHSRIQFTDTRITVHETDSCESCVCRFDCCHAAKRFVQASWLSTHVIRYARASTSARASSAHNRRASDKRCRGHSPCTHRRTCRSRFSVSARIRPADSDAKSLRSASSCWPPSCRRAPYRHSCCCYPLLVGRQRVGMFRIDVDDGLWGR